MKWSWKRDYLLLISGQMISIFGSSLHLVVVILFLKELTGQASSIGIFQLVAYIPLVLLSPLGGVVADSLPPKRIIVLTDLVRGLIMPIMALLLFRELLSYELLLFGTFLISICTAFFQPAVHAIFPSVVEDGALRRANSIRGAGLLGSNFAGTSLGGIAFVIFGPAAIFLVNGISFLLSALEEQWIRVPPRPDTADDDLYGSRSGNEVGGKTAGKTGGEDGADNRLRCKGRFVSELAARLKESLHYLRADRGALSAILTYGMIHAVYPPVVLALPFFLDEVLDLDSSAYGLAMALLLAGGGAGALLYGFFTKGSRRNVPLLYGSLLLP